ncbi:hypothetical protein CKO25_03665 [Thiocapsa imhoffii]|uniref:Uncharacterized protein n=1 Tax=Thiocapsa imhoffii TaxID=382777 RepID=A0A9X0WFJ7_9GAMM|nr:hypothetical protein [Thiocapsa imhoffii]
MLCYYIIERKPCGTSGDHGAFGLFRNLDQKGAGQPPRDLVVPRVMPFESMTCSDPDCFDSE